MKPYWRAKASRKTRNDARCSELDRQMALPSRKQVSLRLSSIELCHQISWSPGRRSALRFARNCCENLSFFCADRFATFRTSSVCPSFPLKRRCIFRFHYFSINRSIRHRGRTQFASVRVIHQFPFIFFRVVNVHGSAHLFWFVGANFRLHPFKPS